MRGYRVSQPFHLAFPVHDLTAAHGFYAEVLGCPEGRSADDRVDFDVFGHQIVAHLAPEEAGHRATSQVDGDAVPVRHFGMVLSTQEWERLADRLKAFGDPSQLFAKKIPQGRAAVPGQTDGA